MRMITGVLFLICAEQAFAHSLLVPFPNNVTATEILYPVSLISGGLGIFFLLWGIATERPATNHVSRPAPDTIGATESS
ncbi:MAG: hypothetical protein KDA81_09120 [Planctomycetaceae bacterium]|nr:hypothetical protein [Planctomycetaceae bacterium]